MTIAGDVLSIGRSSVGTDLPIKQHSMQNVNECKITSHAVSGKVLS
jgi:hypothetical protein